MNQSISQEFSMSSLLRFAMPTTIMMIFMSLYTIVDGFFVSRFVGTDALSAVNLVYPYINLIVAIAVMLATGGSAVIARKMGEGNPQEARQDFTMIVVVGSIAGVVIGLCGILFDDELIRFFGAPEQLIQYCKDYLFILMIFTPASILQMLFQSFFVTAGRPVLGLGLTILAGILNMVFDYLLIVPGQMGIKGAAIATAMGYLVPSLVGLVYFSRKQSNGLYFSKFPIRWPVLMESCFNGSSEMVNNISTGIVTYLFNIIMLDLLGSDGVAAITVVLYAQFLLNALYMGFSMGVAPVISYNYGSENILQLQRIFKICIWFVLCSSVAILLISLIFASPIVALFSPKGTVVYDIAIGGFLLFSINYLFSGTNIFASAFFTALSNGKVSAILSFLRTFVFIVAGIMTLPQILGVNGVWLAVPFAELMTLLFSICYLWAGKKQYHYC